jgi:DUF1009 family protein
MAFEGRFPMMLAHAASDLAIPVTGFGVPGITSPELEEWVDKMYWLGLGQFEKCIQHMHQDGVGHVIMAGRVAHNSIWKYRGFDRRSLRILGRLANRKADTILGAVVDELASEHIEVLDSSLFVRSCMPDEGLLTSRRKITRREKKDIDFGLPIANQIAGMDIGQTVIVKDQAVIAVESLEGTDEAIRRAGSIVDGDIVVVKVAKPKQDNRFDIPVIGMQTVRSLAEAGGGVIAIMAGRTLFFDQAEAIPLAERHNIGIVAI